MDIALSTTLVADWLIRPLRRGEKCIRLANLSITHNFCPQRESELDVRQPTETSPDDSASWR